jgi:single-strand DNA-binding protein
MNMAILSGRLVRDPELKFIPSTGMAVTKFTLAVDKDLYGEKKQQAVSQGKPTADFINITVFGKSAENCANFLSKGSKCLAHGRIQTGSYETQSGEKKYTFDVIADKVEFLDSKQDKGSQPKPQDESFFDGEDEDAFQPVGDEEIPF